MVLEPLEPVSWYAWDEIVIVFSWGWLTFQVIRVSMFQ